MPSDRQTIGSLMGMSDQPDLSLDVIVLIIFGIFWLVFGLLLFRIYPGFLPYNPDSAYGLFLVLVSFQIITMGKTPFGDLPRSWGLIFIGMLIALAGMVTCFIPGQLTTFVRTLVGMILFGGGIVLFMQLFISERKARLWIKIAGPLRQLTIACALVYVLTTVSGLVTLFAELRSDPRTAILVMCYGVSFFYLSWCVWKVGYIYADQKKENDQSIVSSPNQNHSEGSSIFFREASFPLPFAILTLLGFLITLLGLLLFPVSLGILPFSPDGQLGLMLTIMAIQMLALGDTPLGQYARSWRMMILGIVFAGVGVVSCIAPGILTGMIRIFLGVLNIMGGSLFFFRQFLQTPDKTDSVPQDVIFVHPIIKKLVRTQTVLNAVTLVFGISMLLPGLVSSFIVGGILIVNGALLFILASLLRKVDCLQEGEQEQQAI